MVQKQLMAGTFPIHYTISGAGEAVVLIHGFGQDGAIWQSLKVVLEKQYKVIIPDLPGTGNLESDITGITMETLAENIKLLLDKEQITLCSMIGHSMGGYISLAFAERYGYHLQRLGLFSSTAYADNNQKKEGRKKTIDFLSRHGTAMYLQQSVPKLFSPESNENNPAQIREIIQRYSNLSSASLVHYTEAMMNRPDRTAVLEHFAGPVLFIFGEQDTAIPIDQSLRQSHLPEISYIYIGTHSGHMGMLEETGFCIDAVTYFLSGK